MSDSRVVLCALSLVAPLSPLHATATEAAHSAQAADTEPQPSTFDNIWKFADWYENDDNSVLQSLQFSGRFQLDYAIVDADQGHHTEWNIRRFRLGAKAKLFRQFTLHGEVELNPQEADPVFDRPHRGA